MSARHSTRRSALRATVGAPASSRTARLAVVVALTLSVLPGCAWSNRVNRPLWNAFEENLVPQDEGWFLATLPLTIPGGILAILGDTFIVHPISVADDAYEDAGEVWKDPQWEEHYYTELATLPFRVVVTPVVFLGSFLARSMFDLPPPETEASRQREQEQKQEQDDAAARAFVIWLEDVAAGGSRGWWQAPPAWTPELTGLFDRALGQASALGRYELYGAGQRLQLPPWLEDPGMGLRDPDPVVRFLVLRGWSDRSSIPEPLREALRQDPNGAVAELAREWWP